VGEESDDAGGRDGRSIAAVDRRLREVGGRRNRQILAERRWEVVKLYTASAIEGRKEKKGCSPEKN